MSADRALTVEHRSRSCWSTDENETIYDPACGTGGMLIEVVQHVRGRGGRVQLLWGKVFGQEKNLTTAAIARMNLFLHRSSADGRCPHRPKAPEIARKHWTVGLCAVCAACVYSAVRVEKRV